MVALAKIISFDPSGCFEVIINIYEERKYRNIIYYWVNK